MHNALDRTIDSYARLEQEIARRIPPVFRECCARCGREGNGCCRRQVGQDALDVWWFRTVNTHACGHWWPDDEGDSNACVAMGPDGCVLSAGRPLICSSYFCQRMMAAANDPWELMLFAFLSDLPGWALQVGRTNIALLESAQEAAGLAERLLERLDEAWGLLALSSGLVDAQASLESRQSVALRLTCHNPRCLRPMVRRRMLELLDDAG